MTDNTRVFNVFPVFFRGKTGGFQGDKGEGHTLWTERDGPNQHKTPPPFGAGFVSCTTKGLVVCTTQRDLTLVQRKGRDIKSPPGPKSGGNSRNVNLRVYIRLAGDIRQSRCRSQTGHRR